MPGNWESIHLPVTLALWWPTSDFLPSKTLATRQQHANPALYLHLSPNLTTTLLFTFPNRKPHSSSLVFRQRRGEYINCFSRRDGSSFTFNGPFTLVLRSSRRPHTPSSYKLPISYNSCASVNSSQRSLVSFNWCAKSSCFPFPEPLSTLSIQGHLQSISSCS